MMDIPVERRKQGKHDRTFDRRSPIMAAGKHVEFFTEFSSFSDDFALIKMTTRQNIDAE